MKELLLQDRPCIQSFTTWVLQPVMQLTPQGALGFSWYLGRLLLDRDGPIELQTNGTSALDHGESRSATGSRHEATPMGLRMGDLSGPGPDPSVEQPL